jgi:hypothetical protein
MRRRTEKHLLIKEGCRDVLHVSDIFLLIFEVFAFFFKLKRCEKNTRTEGE